MDLVHVTLKKFIELRFMENVSHSVYVKEIFTRLLKNIPIVYFMQVMHS